MLMLCKGNILYAEKEKKRTTNTKETVKLCLVHKGPVSTSLHQMRNSVHSFKSQDSAQEQTAKGRIKWEENVLSFGGKRE